MFNKDKIVFDVETKNTFADVGGQDNIEKLEVSFIGAYSYNQDKYFSFHEKDFDKFAPILQNAGVLITFAGKRFDIPVLKKYYNFNLTAIPHVDLLEEVELAYGHRVGLNVIATATLGVGKSGHGLDAIEYYKTGNLKALEEYCIQDVRVTKDLYDFIKKEGHVLIPKKFSDEIVKVDMNLRENELPASLF